MSMTPAIERIILCRTVQCPTPSTHQSQPFRHSHQWNYLFACQSLKNQSKHIIKQIMYLDFDEHIGDTIYSGENSSGFAKGYESLRLIRMITWKP